MKSFLLSFFLLTALSCFAQEKNTASSYPGQTSFFAELGGPGILFSANVDRRFTKSNLGIGGRIGLGFVTGDENVGTTGNYDYKMRSVLTVPIQINYIFGKTNTIHAFEVGAGVTFVGREIDILEFYDEDRSKTFGTASFMYRRQPADGGFSFRIGFTPLFGKGYIQPFGAVSVGYNF